ncbi:hypothetical protein AB0E59_17915 [Lentzea sp. NPDC034063]|uniref:hypothetical protein n=1 Tax=unclassified Lentzea TaxID=2643253 RepID=UPI0033C8B60A
MSNRPSAQADEGLRLDAETRKKLVAVVVDANAYGKVGPDLKRLANLAADLAKIGVELWVPEPVAWEWAEHLSVEWDAARKVVNDQLRHLSRAGLPASSITPSYSGPEDLVSAFLQVLGDTPHLKIIELTGANAVAGLKDQILQRKPAKTKSSDRVKTGGSDSAWLRDVVAKAGAPDALLFLSQDTDIRSAYTAWGHAKQPVMREPNTVRATLFEDVGASIDDQWLIARYLADQMPLVLEDAGEGEQGRLVGQTLGLLDAVDLDWADHGLLKGNLTELSALAGLVQVRCEAPERYEPGRLPKDRTIRADAYFLAEAEVAHVVFGLDDGDATGERTFHFDELVVRTTLVLTVRDGQVVDVRPDSETKVFPASSRYGDNWDAPEDLADVLDCIPGLEFPADQRAGWDSPNQEIAVEGLEKQVLLWWSHNNEGELRISIGAKEAYVTCEYDATTWIGGKEGMHLEPPYFLRVETGQGEEPGAWPLAAWVFDRLLESKAPAPR